MDYFILVIFSFSFFVLAVQPILNSNSKVASYQEKAYQESDALGNIVNKTGLQKYDSETHSLYSIASDVPSYLKVLLKTSYYENHLDYYEIQENQRVRVEISEEDTFLGQKKNPIYDYVFGYKKENKVGDFLWNGKDYASKEYLYVNEGLFDLKGTNKDLINEDFLFEESEFYLKKELCPYLLAYLNYQEEEGQAKEIYDRLSSLYIQTISAEVNEVMEKDADYLLHQERLKENTRLFSLSYLIGLILNYVFSFLIAYLVFPLCFKRGRTIAYRSLSLELCSSDNETPRWYRILIRDLILFLLQFSSLFFTPLLLDRLNLLSVELFSHVTLFRLCFFSFLLSILSLLVLLIQKENMDLSDLASSITVVDHKQIYLTEEKEDNTQTDNKEISLNHGNIKYR